MLCIMHECIDCKKYNESMLISYIWQICMEEGAGREPVGGGRRWLMRVHAFIINIGGRGRAGAGRREKTGSCESYVYTCIV